MAFCPKCRYEYKEGIKICSDCKVELVETLSENVIYILEKDEACVDEAMEFLAKNDIDYAKKVQSPDSEGIFCIAIPESKYKDTLRMLSVFLREYNIEHAEESSEDNEDSDNEAIKEPYVESHSYVDSNDRAENYKSGAFVLMGVGAIGIIVLILINLGVIPLSFPGSTTMMINVVMGALFVIFIAVGISSFFSYKKLVKQAGEEDSLEDKIYEWSESILDKEALEKDVKPEDSDEIKFFNRTEALRGQLIEAFPELEESFKEHIIEDLYDRIFGCE